MRLTGEKTITNEEATKVVAQIVSKEVSKGAGIRTMFAGGMDVKEISALTGIRYNHVYNVVKNEIIMHDLEVETSSRNNENSKKNQIVKLLQDGKTLTEVAQELKVMYNYVWQVAKASGLTIKQQEEVKAEVKPEPVVIQPEVKKVTATVKNTKKGAKMA